MKRSPTPQRRRVFLVQLAAAGAVLGTAHAQKPPPSRLDEKNRQAVALGYVHDTTRVNKQKYPQHQDDQTCGSCVLFQGQPADAWGGCPLFGLYQVAGRGWCSAWQKKKR